MSQMSKEFYATASGKQLKLAFKNMKARCYGKMKHCDHNYGKRGITVCNEWLNDIDAFINWALNNGFEVGLSLDRKDNDLGYSPGNCKWSTRQEQLRNQRRNNVLIFCGKKQTLSAWAEELGVEFSTLWHRLNRGLPLEKVLQPGKLKPWRHGTRSGYELHKCRCKECTASNTLRHKLRRNKNEKRT